MELSPTILTHPLVRLEPFEERHRAGLTAAAEADVSIFKHMPFPVAERGYGPNFDWLRSEQDAGRWIPHAVIRTDGQIVGQSCYLQIRARDAGVEIGGTWYRREAHGTAINPAAKLLLLAHAFDCGAERVEFKTDALNAQSRAALTKLGATFEGIFRRHVRRLNGTMRDNAYFAVIREEWPALRAKIEARLTFYPDGDDLGWFAVDGVGQIARFTTGGRGPIPRVVLRNEKLLEAATSAAAALPRRGEARVLISMPKPDDFLAISAAGLFGYDCDDITSGRDTRIYRLTSVPSAPLSLGDLPEVLQRAMVRLPALRFGDVKEIAPNMLGDVLLPQLG